MHYTKSQPTPGRQAFTADSLLTSVQHVTVLPLPIIGMVRVSPAYALQHVASLEVLYENRDHGLLEATECCLQRQYQLLILVYHGAQSEA